MIGHAVRPKVELGASRYSAKAHRIEAVVAFLSGDGERLKYRASWLCGGWSGDAMLLSNADAYGGDVCEKCQNGAAGIFVYRCFAGDGRLLYIGFTAQLGTRMAGHKRSSPWWPEVAKVTRQEFTSEPAALAAERLAIQSEHPAYNRQWVTS